MLDPTSIIQVSGRAAKYLNFHCGTPLVVSLSNHERIFSQPLRINSARNLSAKGDYKNIKLHHYRAARHLDNKRAISLASVDD